MAIQIDVERWKHFEVKRGVLWLEVGGVRHCWIVEADELAGEPKADDCMREIARNMLIDMLGGELPFGLDVRKADS